MIQNMCVTVYQSVVDMFDQKVQVLNKLLDDTLWKWAVHQIASGVVVML